MFLSQRRRKSGPLLSSERVNGDEKVVTVSVTVSVCDCDSLVCEGGPLVYDGVQLVQNSAALNGTQRVLLDQVITPEECSALKHLAHVRLSHSGVFGVLILFLISKCVFSPSGCHRSRRRLPREDVSSHSK